jgi:hypothetical protein
MYRTWLRNIAIVFLGLVFLAGSFSNQGHSAGDTVQAEKSTSGPHYTIVETEGHNLVVTDNATNTLYFYTVDKGQSPGADLKLRASVDLNDVGKPVIKPKDVNIQK